MKNMGWGNGAVLVALRVIFLCMQPRAAAADAVDLLPPILSPIIDGLCNAVECGKGKCRVSPDHAFGFVCECDPGWTKLHFGDHLQFLPCVIPNCTFDYSCSNSAIAPASSLPSPPLWNLSMFDPCSWSYCGEGTCLKTSEFGHRCDCSSGYDNLLNAGIFPCFKECVVGADCARLGLVLPVGPSLPSPSSPSLSGSTPNRAAARFPWSLVWSFLLMLPLAMAHRT